MDNGILLIEPPKFLKTDGRKHKPKIQVSIVYENEPKSGYIAGCVIVFK